MLVNLKGLIEFHLIEFQLTPVQGNRYSGSAYQRARSSVG